MKYRKLPVEIEAVAVADMLRAFAGDWNDMPDWVADAYEKGVIVHPTDKCLTIKTLEGDMTGTLDDMLIQGVQGEIYPCKSSIFKETYEEVDDD